MSPSTSHLVAAVITLATGALMAAGAPADAPAAGEQAAATSAREVHVAVIVNLSNPVNDLSLKELRSMVGQTRFSTGLALAAMLAASCATASDHLDTPTVTTNPRADIADYLGTSIETICRTLHDFQSKGLISLPTRKTIRFLDPSGLERIAEG